MLILMYVFIFIGLCVLCFDFWFVLIIGLVVVFGWFGLVFYVVFVDMDGMWVICNYVEYLIGNLILIGVEFDKIMVILVVMIFLLVVFYWGWLFLFVVFRDQMVVVDLKCFFVLEVVVLIINVYVELQVGEGFLCDVVIFYVDICFFIFMFVMLLFEKVLVVLVEYQNLVVEVIYQEGGWVDKFLGDGILVMFGVVMLLMIYVVDLV